MTREVQPVLERFLERAREPGRVVRTNSELHDRLAAGAGRVVTVNLYELHHYVHDPAHRALVDSADAWTADGWPVVRALATAGVTTDRVTGSGLCADLLSLPAEAGLTRVAILGSDDAAVDAYACALSAGGRELVLRDSGRRDDWTRRSLGEALSAARPDLLLVAVGTPWGVEVAARLGPAPGCPVLSVGAGIGMATGLERRAPRSAQRLHAEWAWRLVADPGRLWRRYVLQCAPVLPPLRAAARAVGGRTLPE